MTGHIDNALAFLVQSVIGAYILIVMLRLLLQWVRADFHNPVSQFVIRATDAARAPLKLLIPTIGRIDGACLSLLLILQSAETLLLGAITGSIPSPGALLLFSMAEIVQLALNVFLFSILIEVIMSWINPFARNPVLILVHSINYPLLAPARRIIPPVAGIDLSPIVVILILQLGGFLIVNPLRGMAIAMW
ncbi:YggT family protein [Thioalkalivibrio sp. HK1]|uniref:YggT family protein n=1 Tax=Thioalkalivibrio sp. HK1 TaxID=1469245 RepID=UPI0004712CC6|nr:YggT family protein [Thioalkalivibrio sp. HK1]